MRLKSQVLKLKTIVLLTNKLPLNNLYILPAIHKQY